MQTWISNTLGRLTRQRLSASAPIEIDSTTQKVLLYGVPMALPHKPSQVLFAVVSSAPSALSRRELIDRFWNGNILTGDKGVNQSMWLIRSSLSNAGGVNDWIETLPRQGYRWMGPLPLRDKLKKPAMGWSRKLAVSAIGVVTLALLSSAVTTIEINASNEVDTSPKNFSASNGSSAVYDGQALTVRHTEGCVFRFVPSAGKRLISAAFSTDGKKLAVNVVEAKHCSTRVFDFKTRTFEELSYCLTQT